jgi:cold shock CspA family protein
MLAICKWFCAQRGFGFLRALDGELAGTDIFVHWSALVTSCASVFRHLVVGEYVQFDAHHSQRGLSAVRVTGVLCGPLMCESVHTWAAAGPHQPLPSARSVAATAFVEAGVTRFTTLSSKQRGHEGCWNSR